MPIVTLESIVEKYVLWDVDILVVDVEGWEPEVFKSISFESFRPKLVIFESMNLTSEECSKIFSYFPDCYIGCELKTDSVLIRTQYEFPRLG